MSHSYIVATVPVDGVATEHSEPVTGHMVSVLVPARLVARAASADAPDRLAVHIGADVAARLLVPDDAKLTREDRVGGESEDDDHTHRRRKRAALRDAIVNRYVALIGGGR